MFSVIFEVLPAEGRRDDYVGLAKHLKPILERVEGFVDNERFESQLRPGWVLSHSTWRVASSFGYPLAVLLLATILWASSSTPSLCPRP